MENIARSERIHSTDFPNRDRASLIMIDKTNRSVAPSDRDLPNPSRAQELENVFIIPTSRRPVILRANRNIDETQQLAHPILPASAVEHNRNPTLVGRSRRCNTQLHVMPVNLHNRHPAQPSRIELCRERRKHGCICRHHRPFACPAKNHDRRNRRRFRSTREQDRAARSRSDSHRPEYRAQRMRAHGRDQRRSSAEKRKRRCRIRRRASR